MKKNLFYLFALFCSMSLFIACSNDDDPNWKKLTSQAITAENLILTTNTQQVSGASVRLAMADAQNGVLTLTKAVRGMDEVEVHVVVNEQADGAFGFQGEQSVATTRAVADLVSSTTVKVTGTISLDNKAVVEVETSASGNLVKKIKLCDALYFGQNNERFAPCRINWVSSYNTGVAADNVQTLGTTALSVIMIKLLKDVEFKANGSIVANYAKDVNIDQNEIIMGAMGQGLPSVDGISWLTSPENLAYWYAADDHIYVVLDIANIIAESMKGEDKPAMNPETIMGIIEGLKGMSGADIKNMLSGLLDNLGSDSMLAKLDITKISDADIKKLVGYLIDGFPLDYKVTEVTLQNGSKAKDLFVYVDKNVFDIFMPAVYPMLPDLDTFVKGLTVEIAGQPAPLWNLINALTQLNSLTEFEGIWKTTTVFNVGLDLTNDSFKVK